MTRLEVDAETGVVFSRFFNAVKVVALLTSTGFAVCTEQFLELVEEIGLRAEVGEVLTLGQGSAMACFMGIRS